jgi:hypothetical protein
MLKEKKTKLKTMGDMTGVLCHSKFLLRAIRAHTYMVHAKNQMLQELVVGVLAKQEIYDVALEMETLENGIEFFRSAMEKLVGSRLNADDRRSVVGGGTGTRTKTASRPRWMTS